MKVVGLTRSGKKFARIAETCNTGMSLMLQRGRWQSTTSSKCYWLSSKRNERNGLSVFWSVARNFVNCLCWFELLSLLLCARHSFSVELQELLRWNDDYVVDCHCSLFRMRLTLVLQLVSLWTSRKILICPKIFMLECCTRFSGCLKKESQENNTNWLYHSVKK